MDEGNVVRDQHPRCVDESRRNHISIRQKWEHNQINKQNSTHSVESVRNQIKRLATLESPQTISIEQVVCLNIRMKQ